MMEKSVSGFEIIRIDDAIVKIESSAVNYEYTSKTTKIDSPKLDRPIVNWGEENKMPNELITLVGKNPVASAALPFLIDLTYGSGVKMGKKVNNTFVEYTLEEFSRNKQLLDIKNFLENNDVNAQLMELISDLHWFSHGYVEFIFDKEGKNIVSFETKEATYSRLEQQDPVTGKINKLAYSAKWDDGAKAEDIEIIEMLDVKNPIQDVLIRMGRMPSVNGKLNAKKIEKIVMPMRLPTPGKSYYPKPYWVSIVDSGWLDYSNSIVEFKKAYMKNSMTIKYIVQISRDYFPRIFNEAGATNAEEREQIKRQTLADIKKYLQGIDAAGKSIITYTKPVNDSNVEIPEIQIQVLPRNTGGEFIEDTHEANAMIYTAFRVHPSLIGVIPGKNVSNLSGSDKRELLRISQSLQGRIRQVCTKFLYLMKKVNNWPDEMVFAISDIILTTLDSNTEVTQLTVV